MRDRKGKPWFMESTDGLGRMALARAGASSTPRGRLAEHAFPEDGVVGEPERRSLPDARGMTRHLGREASCT